MSYCRWLEGDLYLYDQGRGLGWVCCRCPLLPEGHDWEGHTIGEVVLHLERHLAAGHDVDEDAVLRARSEEEEHGADWSGQP